MVAPVLVKKVKTVQAEPEVAVRVETPAGEVPVEAPKKKPFFSLSIGKKTKKEDAPEKEKSGLGKFFASINNAGMGKLRVALIQSMAVMMGAGLPLIDTLKTQGEEIRNRAMKKMVLRITEAVENGVPL